jgi:thiamine pyrophosphokinase
MHKPIASDADAPLRSSRPAESDRANESLTGPIVIFNGGPPPRPEIARWLPSPAYVIAVDRGYEHAAALDVDVDELIGDFDSLDSALVASARELGVTVASYPTDKDFTDLDLALQRAVALTASDITVVCGDGWEDRFDHVAAQLGLLANPMFAPYSVAAWFGNTFVASAHPSRPLRVSGRPGETITLLAIGGEVGGVTTIGLKYPLRSETISPFGTRSVSNEFLEPHANISVDTGSLLVVIPNALPEMIGQ